MKFAKAGSMGTNRWIRTSIVQVFIQSSHTFFCESENHHQSSSKSENHHQSIIGVLFPNEIHGGRKHGHKQMDPHIICPLTWIRDGLMGRQCLGTGRASRTIPRGCTTTPTTGFQGFPYSPAGTVRGPRKKLVSAKLASTEA